MLDGREGSGRGFAARDDSTSATLINRAKANETEAWSRLSDLYGPLAYWCRRSGVNAHDSADIVQEVFQALAANLKRFRKERSGDSFRGWLWTITRNKIRDHFRAAGRRPAAIGGTDAHIRFLNEAEQVVIAKHDSTNVQRPDSPVDAALESIRGEFTDHTWRAFWLSVISSENATQVAAELEMSPNAVRLAKWRVLRRLKEILGDQLQGAAGLVNDSGCE